MPEVNENLRQATLSLEDKVNALASDTIMGAALNKEFTESVEKLQKAVEEHKEAEAEENTQVPENAITGDQLEALKRAGYYRKTRPIVRDSAKIGRNDPCPCGSGKKYKNCCMNTGKYETTHYE